jgi:hypothetical protein
MRKALEADIERRIADAEGKRDGSWAQTSRLSAIARQLRNHQDLAAAFGRVWPAIASAEAYEARVDVASDVSREANVEKRRAEEAARKALDARKVWEKKHPIPAAQEAALWRRGERLTLQHQPDPDREPNVHLRGPEELMVRIRDGRMETNGGFGRPAKDFSRIFRAAVAAATEQPGERDLWFGRDRLSIDEGGNVNIGGTGRFFRAIILFDELMSCAELHAPRLHAKAQVAVAAAAEREDAPEEEDDVGGEGPAHAGMAP